MDRYESSIYLLIKLPATKQMYSTKCQTLPLIPPAQQDHYSTRLLSLLKGAGIMSAGRSEDTLIKAASVRGSKMKRSLCAAESNEEAVGHRRALFRAY